MSTKVVTWLAVGIAVIALGIGGYFLISSRAATAPQLPCVYGEDPECPPPGGGGQPFVIEAAVTCGYTDGRAEEVLSSGRECESDTYWAYHMVYPNGQNRVDNPNPQTPPPPPGESDPNEIGACFINYKQLPRPPDPENPPEYEWYIDTFKTCLDDDYAYAFCVDESATTPDNCEYISQPL